VVALERLAPLVGHGGAAGAVVEGLVLLGLLAVVAAALSASRRRHDDPD
jgi:hypothetical protein